MGYKRETIIKKIEKQAKPLYQEACVNYTGVTTDTKEKYTEIIAAHLLSDIEGYKNSIRPVRREGSYKVKGHKSHKYDPADKSILRKEERLARSLYGCKCGNLEILDYQVPLKNVGTEENKGLGKIDLLAWDGENLVILELKRPGSDETLLRCILEAYTYLKTVDRAKLAEDFKRMGAPVRTAALVFKGSQPHNDWLDGNQPYVKELMKRLGVGLYVLDNDTDLKIISP
jgi:hypothetical protein